MGYLKFIFILAVFFNISEETYIHNGADANPGQFPYMVSIQTLNPSREHYCGGSIIDARWVITVAHCMDKSTYEVYEIEAGNVELYSGPYNKVNRIVVHPSFREGFPLNDIALMQIRENSFDFLNRNIRAVKLFNKEFAVVGDTAVAAGWGQNENDIVPTHLQYTNQLRIADCNKRDAGLDAQLICINHDPRITTCFRDSGGPLVLGESPFIYNDVGKLIGLIRGSNGDNINPCRNGDQNDFTRIHYYKDWVLTHVDNQNMFE